MPVPKYFMDQEYQYDSNWICVFFFRACLIVQIYSTSYEFCEIVGTTTMSGQIAYEVWES